MADASVLIGGAEGARVIQLGAMSNRHGLIAGATGTGKTVTLQVLAEGFARIGVPVFAADVKGDLSGIAAPAKPHKEVDRRIDAIGIHDYEQRGFPTVLWDVFAEHGHPVRTTISELGPLILSSLLELNETQTGILYACFAIADDEGMLLLDLKDLRSMLLWMGDNAKTLRSEYGNISAASLGAIQRRLLVLEQQGAERFFGEPSLQLADLMRTDPSGMGVVNLLHAERLIQQSPKLYAAFLMWLLSELFEELPEAGDADRPKLVVFFDEAHLLFDGMQKSVIERIEQVVRLIRSKGVGIYFITQSPNDLPDDVLGQLGLKVQHALRAFTPKDQRAIKAVADGFRNDNGMEVADRLVNLGVGEALVSTLDVEGAPTSVVETLVCPPHSQIGPINKASRKAIVGASPLAGKYTATIDRESAYEMLASRAEASAARQVEIDAEQAREAKRRARKQPSAGGARRSRRSSRGDSAAEAFFKSAARAVGRSLGSKLVRGLLGSLLK